MAACRRAMPVPVTRCQPVPISVARQWVAQSAPLARSVHRCTTALRWSTRLPRTVITATSRSIAVAARKCPMSAVRVVRSRRIRCVASRWCKDISTKDSARIHLSPESASSVSVAQATTMGWLIHCKASLNCRCEYGSLCISLCRFDHCTTRYPYRRPLCSGQGRRTSTVSNEIFYYIWYPRAKSIYIQS